MSHNLNSPNGVTYGILSGTTRGYMKGDTRSLDYSSYKAQSKRQPFFSETRVFGMTVSNEVVPRQNNPAN